MFAPAAPAPLSYGPVQKYRYACCGASAAPRSTRDAHVAEPRIAYRVRLEASTAAPHQAHRPFLDEPLERDADVLELGVGEQGLDALAAAVAGAAHAAEGQLDAA